METLYDMYLPYALSHTETSRLKSIQLPQQNTAFELNNML